MRIEAEYQPKQQCLGSSRLVGFLFRGGKMKKDIETQVRHILGNARELEKPEKIINLIKRTEKKKLKEEVARATETGFKDGRMAVQEDLKRVVDMLEGGCVGISKIANYIRAYMIEDE